MHEYTFTHMLSARQVVHPVSDVGWQGQLSSTGTFRHALRVAVAGHAVCICFATLGVTRPSGGRNLTWS